MSVPPPYFDADLPPPSKPTAREVLELLWELERQRREDGTITREEFQARKAELLDRIRRHKHEGGGE